MKLVESPLDRFLRTRGASILGQNVWGRSWKIQAGVGAVCLAAAAGMGIGAAAFGPPELAFGALGPGIAGIVNLCIGLGFRAAGRKQGATLALSPEARALLHALVVRSMVWQPGRRVRVGAFHPEQTWVGYTAPAEPPTEAMALLDRGAEAHNRLTLALADARNERSNRLRSAADAGMVELLERTVLLAARSSDLAPGLAEMEDTVQRLTELAERVEATTSLPEGTSNLRSTLDATLEELRAEDVARQELTG